MGTSTWPVNNTVVLSLTGLQDRDGNYQNSATVTLQSLVDSNGRAVSGVTTPLTLDYVSGSNGNYEAEISASASVTKGKRYRGTIRAVSGSLQYQAVEHILAKERNN